MRNYWRIKRGIKYPTTITIPIPTEPELYLIVAGIIMFCMWIGMIYG